MKPDYVAVTPSPLDNKSEPETHFTRLRTQDGGLRPVIKPEDRISPAFDRTAYQREYMRKRRAAAKEAK